MESVYCVNCGSAGASELLENEQIRQCIEQWTAPLLVQSDNYICSTCWTTAEEMINTNTSESSNVGRNCALCNRTLAPRVRSHQLIGLRRDGQHHEKIRNIITEKLMPLQIRASHYICHPCWQKADRAAKQWPAPSKSKDKSISNKLRCANCGLHLIRQKRHILHEEAILVQIQQRVAPQIVTANDYICGACHTLFVNRDTTSQDLQDATMVGHQHICVACGCSVARIRSHQLQAESSSHILDIVRNWIQPREIQPSDALCNKCFQRADTTYVNDALSASVNPASQPQHTESIILPNYSRASDTHSRCIFLKCNSTSQRVVPLELRVQLFRDHNYYVPPNCRICELHLASQSWSELFDVENVNRSFTATHIEDFCELLFI